MALRRNYMVEFLETKLVESKFKRFSKPTFEKLETQTYSQ